MRDRAFPLLLRWLVRVSAVFLPTEVRDEITADLRAEYIRGLARGEGRWRAGFRTLWYVVSTDYLALRGTARRLRAVRSGQNPRRESGRSTGGAGGLELAFKHALRSTARSPGFSALAIATIASGVGGVAAVSGVLSAVLLDPLPYRNANELVVVSQGHPEIAADINASDPQFRDWSAEAGSFSSLAAWRGPGWTVVTNGPEPERVPSVRVTANFFETIGVAPGLGREFTVEEGRAGGDRVALVSRELWSRLGTGDSGPERWSCWTTSRT
jgi:hypothetical protein